MKVIDFTKCWRDVLNPPVPTTSNNVDLYSVKIYSCGTPAFVDIVNLTVYVENSALVVIPHDESLFPQGQMSQINSIEKNIEVFRQEWLDCIRNLAESVPDVNVCEVKLLARDQYLERHLIDISDISMYSGPSPYSKEPFVVLIPEGTRKHYNSRKFEYLVM